jgi:hypothetical protein
MVLDQSALAQWDKSLARHVDLVGHTLYFRLDGAAAARGAALAGWLRLRLPASAVVSGSLPPCCPRSQYGGRRRGCDGSCVLRQQRLGRRQRRSVRWR